MTKHAKYSIRLSSAYNSIHQKYHCAVLDPLARPSTCWPLHDIAIINSVWHRVNPVGLLAVTVPIVYLSISPYHRLSVDAPLVVLSISRVCGGGGVPSSVCDLFFVVSACATCFSLSLSPLRFQQGTPTATAAHISISMSISISTYFYLYLLIYLYIYIYICIHVYIHI